MAPTLEDADGRPVDVTPPDADTVNAQFSAAMNDDGPDGQAPPKRQPRTEAPQAAKPRAGRAGKQEKARTADKPAEVIKDDYAEDAQQAVGAVWTAAAAIPWTQPYALVIEGNSDALAASLAEGAKHNATIRRFLASGGNSWMLGLASVGLTMSMQCYQLARDPALRREAAETTREHLKDAMRAKGFTVPEPAGEPAAA